MGQDSSISLATRHGLDGPRARIPSRPALESNQTSVQWVLLLFHGVKRPGRGAHHQPSSRAQVEERVELYLYPHPSVGFHGLFEDELLLPEQGCDDPWLFLETTR